ncbi:hypothetical protein ABIF69_008439 [Bradyrhizobium japonicum]
MARDSAAPERAHGVYRRRVGLEVGGVGHQAAEPQVDCFCRQWVSYGGIWVMTV